ncbi:MAG TPA: tetratricopeptide repeat protein [Anaeromyxobacteraceae bacterium]|nr:tetratricopeptide repeat protein [Anaeromyxobacteraceae bacterium]
MSRRFPLALAALLSACSGAPPRPPAPPPPPRVDPAPLLAEAIAARGAGDAGRARERLEAAIAADPGWDLPRLELAELLLEGAVDPAPAEALLAAPAREDNPRLWRVRGAARELAGDAAAAADHYRAALALRDDVELRLHRALLLDGLGRLDEAAAELERVRVERPDDLAPLARLADVYERTGRLAEAEQLLVGDANAAPPRPEAWLRLARFYGRIGQAAKAADAEKRARDGDAPRRRLRSLAPSRR